jgi:hypothetical protein
MLEAAQRAALALGRGRVFADTWALELFSACPHCFAARCERLETVNRTQRDVPLVRCAVCGGSWARNASSSPSSVPASPARSAPWSPAGNLPKTIEVTWPDGVRKTYDFAAGVPKITLTKSQ